jgi:DNA (cytosine-5)-methyltransferase 1
MQTFSLSTFEDKPSHIDLGRFAPNVLTRLLQEFHPSSDKTIATLFTGIGGVNIGTNQLGLSSIWGVEIDEKLVDIYNTNFKNKIKPQDLLALSPKNLERPDILWASPPCVRASMANPGRGETPEDSLLAAKICEFLEYLQPPKFVLENVEGYAKFESFQLITRTLYSLGYWVSHEVLNAKNFGVPQSRRRLILRAAKDNGVPLLNPDFNFKSWDESINIADCIEGEIPDRHRETLEVLKPPHNSLVSVSSSGRSQIKPEGLPAFTVTVGMCRSTRLNPIVVQEDLKKEKALFLGTKNLARLQGFPESYKFCGVPFHDGRGIGNAVPPPFAKVILSSLLD